jgi:hypothetical protein
MAAAQPAVRLLLSRMRQIKHQNRLVLTESIGAHKKARNADFWASAAWFMSFTSFLYQ